MLEVVFFGETYVNEHHVTDKTWLGQDKKRMSASGKGPRFVVIGDGMLWMHDSRLAGEWVPDSLQLRQSDKKTDHEDYHVNLIAVIFEKWFAALCEKIEQYGPCRIHMDGARYHVRCINPNPTQRLPFLTGCSITTSITNPVFA